MSKNIYLIVVGAFGIVALIFWLGYQEIVILHKKNQELTMALKDTNDALVSEVTRSKRIEESTVHLMESENARQTELRSFEGKLRALATQNNNIRNILTTVIPVELVRSLPAFHQASNKRPIKDTSKPYSTH